MLHGFDIAVFLGGTSAEVSLIPFLSVSTVTTLIVNGKGPFPAPRLLWGVVG